MLLVIMLARLNTPSEVSILPTGLGNHYTSSSRHLIPPGRRRFPYNHSVSGSDCFMGDPNAPEANMSFREQHEYFGPDVLVILGLVLACLGAVLTLVSFYCQFKHPAIQATMAGIGPSLVGIGMLFCILRLFFCTFCIRRTCCECLGDGLRFLALRFCPRRKKKKVHPLRVSDPLPTTNGRPPPVMMMKPVHHSNGKAAVLNNNVIEMARMMEPIKEELHHQKVGNSAEVAVVESVGKGKGVVEEDILKDEIDLLDEMKSDASESPNSHISLHKNINELVLKTQARY